MTCEERREEILLYAAAALEGNERDALLDHLRSGCPRCAGSLAEAEAVLAHLPLALEPVVPSPAVRERLLARIQADAPSSRRVDRKPLAAAPFPGARRADRWLDAWLRPAIAAALAAAIVYGTTALPLRREQETLGRELARRAEEVRRLQASAEEAVETARMLSSREAVVATLGGGEPQPEAWGRILWDRDRGTVHFYTGNLAPPGPGRTYELWLITEDEKKIPAGTFEVDAARRGALITRVARSIGKVAFAAVTDEPAGGVAQPTGSIQLLGKLEPARS